MYIFISHSSKDAKVANEICEAIERTDNRCFLAPRDIRTGREYAEELVEGIDRSDAIVLVLSNNSIASPHVLREIERAVSKKIPIIVYKLEEVELTKSMEYFLMTHQWLNAKTGSHYEELVAALDNIKDYKKPEEGQEKGAYEKSSVKSTSGKIKKKYMPEIIVVAVIAVVLIFALADIFTKKFPADTGNSMGMDATGETGGLTAEETDVEPLEVDLGDTVIFGSYNGEPIEWRVLKLSEDSTQAVLITSNIITMKAYDAAEGGKFNCDGDVRYYYPDSEADMDLELQKRIRGNNDWSVSNIRTWLNSSLEMVEYADQPPASYAMAELKNGYNNEPGFLNDFTDEELAAIIETEIITNGNALADGNVKTVDKVFLLSVEELEWFKEADISIYAKPTQAALDQDTSQWYEVEYDSYGVDTYYWWLREPVEGTSSMCYMVSNGYYEKKLIEYNVGVEGFGIRPAVTVDLTSDQIIVK